MHTLIYLINGFGEALLPINIALALGGCFVGTLMGSLPGLGPVNGVAVLIPVVYSLQLQANSALILLVCVYYGCMFGGRVSSIMLNIPGDEPAMMTCLDGYPMAQNGKAPEALAISAIASFVGAIISTIGLMFFAPLLVSVAIHFGPSDYFALYVLALTTIGGLTGTNLAKSLLAAAIGLALSTVGLDHASGVARFTFGDFNLYDGFNVIVAIVGLFAISEVLMLLEMPAGERKTAIPVKRAFARWSDIRGTLPTMGRGSIIGFISGILPGAGASLGSFLSYTVEQQISNKNNTFGKGDPKGVAAPEAGNNAAAGGALVPMLALGVPGSGTTAVLLALLISLNVTPGPLLFHNQPQLVWGLIAALFIANIFLLMVNLPLVGVFTRVMSIPLWALLPFVLMISFVGVYSISHSTFDLLIMVAFGVFGFVLRKLEFPLVPVILGLLLGPSMEYSMRRALAISAGDPWVFVSNGIAIGLYIATFILLAIAIFVALRKRRAAS